MAPHDGTPVSIDDDVAFVTEQIEALRQLGQRDDVDDEEIYDLSIRWGTALAGRLPRVAHYSSLGRLADDDQRRFQSLCDQLRELSPLIDRFDLARPQLPGSTDGQASGGRQARKRPSRFLRR
ncbi:hypothetical protein MMAN_24800 [Mycobacterium mantenii]|uniref:Uncharacterized protein n=1 Tax=Mycobacterium mantenii TaxID=560555 RepID=A0A1X0FZY0_MYCNT|nr:hypothetical protein [Mycobacterium mantenii]MCV7243331.1 hypothetical protein [Mycobacterium mantenii]ORB07296.1 hypothetical protein BST30_07350 [Mycobacterium mantenii]BBY38346.1 hypothetical protein MMAN_24800 [Mycobacterium mantenii]